MVTSADCCRALDIGVTGLVVAGFGQVPNRLVDQFDCLSLPTPIDQGDRLQKPLFAAGCVGSDEAPHPLVGSIDRIQHVTGDRLIGNRTKHASGGEYRYRRDADHRQSPARDSFSRHFARATPTEPRSVRRRNRALETRYEPLMPASALVGMQT